MRVRWTTTKIAEGKAMREAGATWLEVGQAMGCSENAARYRFSHYRKDRNQYAQRLDRIKRRSKKPKLFPYVGQFDPETGRQSW